MNVLKAGFGVVILSVVLAGCSSTQEVETQEPVAPTTDTSTVDTSGIDSSGVEEEVEEAVELETVFYFDFDESTIKYETRALLTAHAEELMASPRSIRLEGHADERGSREYNMALGERRANAVRDFLVLQGVDSSLIETVSYGEERPAAFGSNEDSWELNRRVELK